MRPALEDVRIVSLEQYGAGPWGTVHLAALGAGRFEAARQRVLALAIVVVVATATSAILLSLPHGLHSRFIEVDVIGELAIAEGFATSNDPPPDPSVTDRRSRYRVRTRAPPAGAAIPLPSFVMLCDSRHPIGKGRSYERCLP